MKIDVKYVLPAQDAALFSHLKSNVLDVSIDTDMLDSIDDLEGLIADTILRTYGITVEKLHTEAITDWPKVRARVNIEICKRLWCDANERAYHLAEMRDITIRQMTETVGKANKQAEDLKSLYLKSLTDADMVGLTIGFEK